MKVNEYIQYRVEHCSDYTATDNDQKIFDTYGVEAYIYRKLMSKKFRKWSLPEKVKDLIKEQVHHCVVEEKPITLSLSYGGFKLWRLPTSPEVDWGEFFYIAHHIQYMATIACLYEPGVRLDFSSGDIAVTSLNNVPREDTDRYFQSLQTLIGKFASHLPKNITIQATRLRDLFDSESQFITEGEKLRIDAKKQFSADKHLADEFSRGAIQNIQTIKGKEDLSNLSDIDMQRLRERSAEIIFSMYEIPQISSKDEKGEIALMATNIALPIPMIATGGTKYSTAKFWAGLGVLAKNDGKFAEYIVTPKQWEKIQEIKHEVVGIDFLPLKNFKQILVYPKKFVF